MNKLLLLREKLNLTQEELAEKSGISIRTIQRIEAGQIPTGYTLKALAKSLGVNDADLLDVPENQNADQLKWIKLINLSSLPTAVLPPLNLLVPIAIMLLKKQNNEANRKLISIQLLWTLIGILLLITVQILNDWYGIRSRQMVLVPLLWILLNAANIVANAAKISRGQVSRIFPRISIL